MSKALRLSEKWFRRGLWLVALVFAGFLIGLGGTVVGDLPKVEGQLEVDDFLDRPAADRLREGIKGSQRAATDAQSALEQARLKHRVAQSDTQSARETFNNWLATRRATQLSDQDPELVTRTKALDALRQAERDAQAKVEQQEQLALNARQAQARSQQQLQEMERIAQEKLNAEYLPSYGGYVRYIVGILVTVIVGRQAIVSLNRYLERQKAAEQLPDAQRRVELSYDTALARLAKGVCPGCERPVDLKNDKVDFCPHCGIGLFDRCGHCTTRKGAFQKFCHSCGAGVGPGLTRPVPDPA
jgi:predicted RNA-binding Zn-ribbon protein involved in translation (DUF1610 family)